MWGYLNPSSIGGGLAFVISPDDETVRLASGYLGLVSEIGTTLGFVSVEFDTLMDIEFKDINGNHVGLDFNSMVSSQVGDLGLVGVELKSGDLGSTKVHSIEGWSFSSSFNSSSASPLPSTPFGYGLSLPPPTSAFFNPTANGAPPSLDSLTPSSYVSSSPQKCEKIRSSSSCHN
ncbi:hypothetical protein IFM89_000502 [Coptis chinensis]|uniref:Legume lectin domain-containing protein n=1 Tax=Coptis chinensis TaxID=261450 RepID=A0A835H396_9MAGN|nr:hypothetical protein IFM89_000502 [Coptis chinensis]